MPARSVPSTASALRERAPAASAPARVDARSDARSGTVSRRPLRRAAGALAAAVFAAGAVLRCVFPSNALIGSTGALIGMAGAQAATAGPRTAANGRPPAAAAPAGAASPLARPATLQIPISPLEEVPYVQTPQSVVDAILALAGVRRGDRLIDLGSGDGRIVITAARSHGAQGLGIELAPHLIDLSNRLAREAGVADRARFVAQDLFDTDLSSASVVTMYLLPDVNLALRPKLLATLTPGTRVVSHDWDMGDWRADRQIVVPAPNKPVGLERTSTLRLWIVPARVDGAWSAAPGRLTLSVRQNFQDIEAELRGDGMPVRRLGGTVSGRSLRLLATDGGPLLRIDGTVRTDRIDAALSGAPATAPRHVRLQRG